MPCVTGLLRKDARTEDVRGFSRQMRKQEDHVPGRSTALETGFVV